ncbi:MAG: hypothetical protein H7A21_02305 [Spirochaetales bacterium]|nr:hypothetical protein [Leptospiraceae bacterium]MCP5480240.1 hypothetical protein [Spirochaetales bacterium]MCP5486361.1 hypothetical protein [Spirochaetales bacterium]
MAYTREEVTALVDRAVERNQVISLVTAYLSDYGEMVLNTISERLLEIFDRADLLDVLYTSLKELVINAGKANLKRAIIRDSGLDPGKPGDYEEIMRRFKANLPERQISKWKRRFKEYDLQVTVSFYYEANKALKIKIKNNFTLLPQEEERIREKFKSAVQYSDLLEFYMHHGDETEGAGLGLTLVCILLNQSGIDRHLFSIYSSDLYQETIARMEIPLSEDYVPKRVRFEREAAREGKSIDEYRSIVQERGGRLLGGDAGEGL